MRKIKSRIKKLSAPIAAALLVAMTGISACQSAKGPAPSSTVAAKSSKETSEAAAPANLFIAAAASLKPVMEEALIPEFIEQNPGFTVTGTYDSSGKLQTQIEEGLEADLFISAATKQMDALNGEGLVDKDSLTMLLENQIVLIVPAGSGDGYSDFTDIQKAAVIAVGDPDSVPAGQYAKEALQSLELWDLLKSGFSLGTNVTEVLNWVAEGSADAGIVYATDAAATDRVTVIASAPEGSLSKKVLYPAAVLSASAKPDAAALFLDYLKSDSASEHFAAYGFSPLAE